MTTNGPKGVRSHGFVPGYERRGFYTCEEVFQHLDKGTHVFDDDVIDMTSARYRLFQKSSICVSCGIVGLWFAKERSAVLRKSTGQWEATTNKWHFNLYALDAGGKLVLMTKDHIQPRSKGGPDADFNYQTMCSPCNRFKSDKLPGDLAAGPARDVNRHERRRAKNNRRQKSKTVARGEVRCKTIDVAWGGYRADAPDQIAYVRNWLVYGDRLFRTDGLVDPDVGLIRGKWDGDDEVVYMPLGDPIGFGSQVVARAYLKGRLEAADILQEA
ncbi:putative HNH endonuclease 5 [Brevundimonas phage vB_BpoS-Domovoi]|uniref:HNH endonuclease 5 n=1 Tax=Brevundimonas phage vB_BpoS-Domovoi TaxID=2948598 RepID=A0A9E7MRF5_9CAUD|nr:putative HNH endonuclease 5 [Brevundimonas phage vB_BpoS-Domovoi]